MLAIFMLPSAAMVMTVSWMIAYEARLADYPHRQLTAWIVSAICMWGFVGTYWLLLWRRSVRWSGWRSRMTLFACAAAALVGALFGLSTRWIDRDFGFFVFAATTPLAWLPMTVFIWRESAAERAGRLSNSSESALSCPVCGYNLTGLSTARCPECGTSFTIDELLRRQPGREQVEIGET
jgi:hypothetical protein